MTVSALMAIFEGYRRVILVGGWRLCCTTQGSSTSLDHDVALHAASSSVRRSGAARPKLLGMVLQLQRDGRGVAHTGEGVWRIQVIGGQWSGPHQLGAMVRAA